MEISGYPRLDTAKKANFFFYIQPVTFTDKNVNRTELDPEVNG